MAVDIKAKTADRATPLHLAAANGQVEAVKTLVQQLSADMEARGADGRTPRHLAAARGHAEAVKSHRGEGGCWWSDADAHGGTRRSTWRG
jgi:ankyrin repeat protein